MQDIDIADLKRIAELIYIKYAYDFRNYAMSSFKRRVLRVMELKKLTVESLLKKLTINPIFVHEFVDEITVNVTEMFRDPGFWRVLNDIVMPAIVIDKQQFRIWHAGCSSGEEVLTMCIILKEMGILEHVSITASDLDLKILEQAKSATLPAKNMEVNEKNYSKFQGKEASLKCYYKANNGWAEFDHGLFANVTFLRHDLVLDQPFSTFDLILCRNVMIYFNQALQNEVLKKFHESVSGYGYLSIGSKESLIWCDYANRFIAVNNDEKIYKKIKD